MQTIADQHNREPALPPGTITDRHCRPAHSLATSAGKTIVSHGAPCWPLPFQGNHAYSVFLAASAHTPGSGPQYGHSQSTGEGPPMMLLKRAMNSAKLWRSPCIPP